MPWYERLLDKEQGHKVARALNCPQGYTKHVIALADLDPITKVQEETFYQFVLNSIKDWGVLYNPLVVYPLSREDWEKELLMDSDQTPPIKRPDNLHLRVQCGCNRFYAIKELGYTAAECLVVPDLKQAQDVAHALRCDKRWQRGSNMQERIKEVQGVQDCS